MLLELAAQQQQMGNTITVASMGGPGPMDDTARRLNLSIAYLGARRSPLSQVSALTSYLKRNVHDVVHSHWAVWMPAALATSLTGPVCIHTNHGNERRIWVPRGWIAKHFTDIVVCLTPKLDAYIERYVRVPKRKIRIIANGIDLSKFSDVTTTAPLPFIPETAPVVGMVARLSPPKDYRTFITAARMVVSALPAVHFIAIGDGPDRPALERLASDIQNFHFLGTRTDVPSLLRRMQISVLSTACEGHSITLLEALAAGCPAIASDIPPNRFALGDGEYGLLFKTGDSEALSSAMLSMLQDGKRRKELAEAGSRWVQQFSSRSMAIRYLDVYREALVRRNAKALRT